MTRRPDPQRPLVLVLNLVLAVFFTAVTVGLVVQGVSEGSTGLWVGGLLLVGPIALTIWVALLGNVLQYRFPRGLPAPRLGTWEGEAGVEVREWSFGRRVVPAMLVAATASGLLLGLGAFLAGQPLFGGVGIVAGGAGVWLLVRLVRGEIGFAGGLWLTPTRLVHRLGAQTSVVAWDDVEEASDRSLLSRHDDEVVVMATRGGVTTTGVSAGAPGGPGGPERSHLTLDTRWFGLPADGLAQVIAAYAQDPALRAELGDERGLQRVTAAAHDVVRRRVAR